MRCLDPGHFYILEHLDGTGNQGLRFVKRQGPNYPGNHSSYEGTNIQEVLRALIAREKYLDNQIPHAKNLEIIRHLRASLILLEQRAAERHHVLFPAAYSDPELPIELVPPCPVCGHVICRHSK